MTQDKAILQDYSVYLAENNPNFEYFGNQENLVSLASALSQEQNNSVLLTGAAGVGRRSQIAGLVKNKAAEGMPLETINTEFYRLNVESLFDTNTIQKVEKKFEAVLKDLQNIKKSTGKKPVLVIDDGTNFVREVVAKKASSLLNMLIDGDQHNDDFDLIFSADNDALHLLKKDYPNFVSKFSERAVESIEDEQVISMLTHEAKRYEEKGLTVTEDAIKAVEKLCSRYSALGESAMPKRASLFLDEVATTYRLYMHSKPEEVHNDEAALAEAQASLAKAQQAGEDTSEFETSIETLNLSLAEAMKSWNAKKRALQAMQDKIVEYKQLIDATQKKIDKELEKARKEEEANANNQEAEQQRTSMHLAKNPKISKWKEEIESTESAIKEKADEIDERIKGMMYNITLDAQFVEDYAKNKLGMNDMPDLRKKILTAEDDLNNIVMGQEQMIKPIVSAIKQRLSRKSEAKKPKGVFLILGPSGVGKTFIAEVLSEELCGNAPSIINMEGFKEKHTVSRMIGSPPGYAGYEDKAELVRINEENPSGVICLDEIEKAHKDVKQSLLTPLDKGRFVSANGKDTADFRDNIIIMTSNYGQQDIILPQADEDFETWSNELKEKIFGAVDDFSPEFLNRCTIVCADFLPPEVIEKVVAKRVKAFVPEYFGDEEGFDVEMDQESIESFVRENYNKINGARVVQKQLEDNIGDYISNLIIENDIAEKNTCGLLKVCYKDGNFTYSSLEEPAVTLTAENENRSGAATDAFKHNAMA